MVSRQYLVCDAVFETTGNRKTCGIECRRANIAEYKREWRKDNPDKARAADASNRAARQRRFSEKKAETVQPPLDRVLARYAKAPSP
jgi:hypothetical protein